MKNLIAALEDNDDPIISPAAPAPTRLKATRRIWPMNRNGRCVLKVSARMQDSPPFIVNKLGWWTLVPTCRAALCIILPVA